MKLSRAALWFRTRDRFTWDARRSILYIHTYPAPFFGHGIIIVITQNLCMCFSPYPAYTLAMIPFAIFKSCILQFFFFYLPTSRYIDIDCLSRCTHVEMQSPTFFHNINSHIDTFSCTGCPTSIGCSFLSRFSSQLRDDFSFRENIERINNFLIVDD